MKFSNSKKQTIREGISLFAIASATICVSALGYIYYLAQPSGIVIVHVNDFGEMWYETIFVTLSVIGCLYLLWVQINKVSEVLVNLWKAGK